MLMDEAEITIKGGHGGPGIVSFGKKAKSGPDGGNGGAGGDFYVKASSDLTLLNQFSVKQAFSAQSGAPGERNKRSGKDGNDFELTLPIGTTLINQETGEVMLELETVGERHLIAQGGKGGRGNWEFRSPRRTTPMIAQPGLEGEKYKVKVVLKLIADFGLIGIPNAGKSSILNELTNAKVKIGSYAFTTLSPNLAVFEGRVIADIPGLIEGASTGRGLGISFLKHIEKVKLLLHCIAADSQDPENDYQTIKAEMAAYNPQLIKKPEVILLTKSDLVSKSETLKLTKVFKKYAKEVLPVSIYDLDSIERLKKLLSK